MEPENLPPLDSSIPDENHGSQTLSIQQQDQPNLQEKNKSHSMRGMVLLVVIIIILMGAYLGVTTYTKTLSTAMPVPVVLSPNATASATPITDILPTSLPNPSGQMVTGKVLSPLQEELRARDLARLADFARLQSIIEFYLTDHGTDAFVENPSVNSQSAGGIQGQDCATNWLGINVCEYIQSVPVEPANTQTISALDANGSRSDESAGYGLQVDTITGEYELCTFLESETNIELLKQDGGTDSDFYEIGTNTSLDCDTE
jgi:hypothetical protein